MNTKDSFMHFVPGHCSQRASASLFWVCCQHSKALLSCLVRTQPCLQIVGITSSCLDADSSDKSARQASAAALRQELEWGIHLGLQACLLPLPPRHNNANFSQVINQVRSLFTAEEMQSTSPHVLIMCSSYSNECTRSCSSAVTRLECKTVKCPSGDAHHLSKTCN